MMARRCLGWSALAMPLLLVTACREPLSPLECQQLLAHYTERLVVDEHPGATATEVSAKQLAAQAAAETRPEFEFNACAKRVKRKQFECAMAASNVDDFERCLIR